MKVLFWINKGKGNGTEAPLWVRITINGKQAQFSTGKQVMISTWDSKSQKMKGRNDKATLINKYIKKLELKLEAIHLNLLEVNDEVTPLEVKNMFKGKNTLNHTLISSINEYISKMEDLLGIDYVQSTINKFKYLRADLKYFLSHKYGVLDINLKKVDREFISEFEHSLLIEKEHKQITASKKLRRLRQVFERAVEYNWINRNPLQFYKIKHVKTEIIYLTLDEIEKVENKIFNNKTLELVRDLFVFSIYSGLAYKEVMSLKKENLLVSVKGLKYINMKRLKTGRDFSTPLFGKAEQILSKYQLDPRVYGKENLLPIISNQKLNSYLKEVITRCDIDKKVSFHTARKTFATSILIGNGVSTDSASLSLGHSTPKTTMDHYGKILPERMLSEIKSGGLYEKFAS